MRSPLGRFGFAGLLMLCAAAPATAQLGGLVKKVKDKTVDEASRASGANAALNGEAVKFNDVLIELTAERVDGLIKGVTAANAAGLEEHAALVARRDAAGTKMDELLTKYSDQMEKAREKRSESERCRSEALDAVRAAREKTHQDRLRSDPALMGRLMEASTKAAELTQKGDTAGLRKLQMEIESLTAPTKADSAATDRKCGVPTKSKEEQEVEGLKQQLSQIDNQIRDNEKKQNDAGVAASGMNSRQFAMAKERGILYAQRVKSSSPPRGFTSNELKALDARRSEIVKLLGG